MASRKKPLFPTVSAALLEATLKSLPPATANEMDAEGHAAIMEKTNKLALEVCQIVESMPVPEAKPKPKPAASKK